MKKVFLLVLTTCLLSFTAFVAVGQDIQTKGSIKGVVVDSNGSVVKGASVTVSGNGVTRTVVTSDNGTFEVSNLSPGNYDVKFVATGFKTATVGSTTVNVGKATVIDPKLEVGEASATVEVTAGTGIDQASTAQGGNLDDQLFSNIPVGRGVAGLFYLTPGTTDGLAGGANNPSISGGSALDNLYVADGVNITNSAFGGIGTFSRSYGALGTGINTAFVKEVQVKTGGFEPQYGQSMGGIVNIITQSGSNEFHGAGYAYFRPDAFEATYKQRDATSFNKVGEFLAAQQYDVGFDAGGPIVKDKLFFFGSYNPSWVQNKVIGAAGSGLRATVGEHEQSYTTQNFAGKLDWNISQNHSLTFSVFGDPTKTNKSSFSGLNYANTTAFSELDYGSTNYSARYNGALSSTWTLSASYGLNRNHFDESGFDDFNLIVDQTGSQAGGSVGTFNAIGRGFIEPTEGSTHTFAIDTNKTFEAWGQHSVGGGFQYQKGFYSGVRDRSGPHYTIPSANTAGTPINNIAPGIGSGGQTTNAQFQLRSISNVLATANLCSLCPVMNVPGASDIGLGVGNRRVYLLQNRGEYGEPIFDTNSDYTAWYAQDTWRINRYITALYGIRWEQEKVSGSPSASGDRVQYTFKNQWAPRLGVTVDPTGKGKMKAFYNYGRFFEYLPLDMAERSLSAEADFTGARFAPAFTSCTVAGLPDRCVVLNSFGTVNPIYDAPHLLNTAPGGTGAGIAVSTNDPFNPILPGTKLGYLDEHLFGYEAQLSKGFVFSARYIDRQIKRVVEDAAVQSPEQANGGLFGQTYFLANVSATLDGAINPIPHLFTPVFSNPSTPTNGTITNWPAVCGPLIGTTNRPMHGIAVFDPRTNAVLGAVCYDPNALAGTTGSDGIPDGFPDVKHHYRAFELEVNKRFANNWQFLANWRIASLQGNYEGHLRNDNGQTDPGISSLFDFTQGDFNLLGDQFASGPLNSDRRHVINVFGSYAFTGNSMKGLNIGFNFNSQSGLPNSEFLAHPVYQNAGEIPVGGRGKLGRTPWHNRVDMHVDYPWNFTEKMRLKFVADFFNIINSREVRQYQEFRELSLGVNNVDFQQPRNFFPPFNMRLGFRFEF